MRYLQKTLAIASLLAPASAVPLGIGDIRLHSALNQNLNADITLSLSGEKPSDIQVSLAPPDKFNEAGIPWSYFLSKLKFQTVARPDGSSYIKLTSTEPLKEPFLDFLLQVTWPQGNLYREFTVLVDPPAVYTQPSAPVINSPATYAAPEPYALPAGRPLRGDQAHGPGTTLLNDNRYGPTRRNDTLWKIAEQVRRDPEVSVEQVLMALFRQNPEAFYKDNVNALAAGKILRIPDRESVLSLTRKEALAELRRQTAHWNDRLADAPAETAPEPEPLDSHLTLKAPAESEVPANAEVAAAKTSPDSASGNPESGNPASETAGSDSPHTATDLLQVKIAALEKQLATMQQLVALKDQQLAALQNQVNAARQPPTIAKPDHAEAGAAPEKPEPAAVEPAAPSSAAPVSQDSAESVSPPALPVKAAESFPAAAAKSAGADQSAPAPKQPAVEPEAVREGSFPFSYLMLIGAVCAAAVAALGWLGWRKRKTEKRFNGEDLPVSSQPVQPFTLTSSQNAAASSPASAESSFITELSSQDFDVFDIEQTEIDPVSEADVYLAYSRHQQAEELIRQAIGDFPERDDCKLKLLEIFKLTDNKKAFEEYANELAAAGKKDDARFWVNVTQLALDICPHAPLFSSTLAHFDAEPEEQPSSAFAEEPAPTAFAEETIPAAIAKADLGKHTPADTALADQADVDNDAAPDHDPAGENAGYSDMLEFDLTDYPFPQPRAVQAPVLDKDRVLEFDFGSGPDVTPANDGSLAAGNKKPELPDFSLAGELAFDLSADDSAQADNLRSEEHYPFNFDFDLPEPEMVEGGVSDLTDRDALETKLDLARAYIDMGDPESAKDIVKEVLIQGTLEQQKIAHTLLVDL